MREMSSEEFNRTLRCRTEADIQRGVCNWLRAKGIRFMSGYLAGIPLTPRQARKAKQQGNDAGMPDLFIARPSSTVHCIPGCGWGILHGLFLEFKRPLWKIPTRGKAFIHWQEQLACAEALRTEGFRVEIPVQSVERAIEILDEHCGG